MGLANEVEKQLSVIRRGVTEIISEEELAKKIEKSLFQQKPLWIKYGIDPTASELHLGHSVPIRKLRDFQNLGHKILFLVGDFTALIGDPTGRTETRPILSPEAVKKNMADYRQQVGKILNLDQTEFVFNSTWLAEMRLAEVIKLASAFTVAQMLEREDFRQRYQKNNPISLQEFLYPLLQGYDSVALRSDVEVGATEQKFNLLAGRTIQEVFGMEKQVVITVPIIEGTDGVRKMSKTYDNYIPLTAPAGELFGKLMSIPDSLTEKYFRCLTDLSELELKKILAGHPKAAKERLAREVVAFYYGEEAASKAAAEFDRIFSQAGKPSDDSLTHPPISLEEPPSDAVSLLENIVRLGFISKSEAKRLVKNGAVSVNGVKITALNHPLPESDTYLVRIGSRRFFKFIKP